MIPDVFISSLIPIANSFEPISKLLKRVIPAKVCAQKRAENTEYSFRRNDNNGLLKLALPYSQSKIEREKVITLIRPENFEAEISETNQPVLLAYISPGHHNRKQIEILHRVAEQVHPLIKFGLIDQNCIAGLKPLNLKGSPTFIILEEGEEKGRMLGKTDSEALNDFIMQALPDLLPGSMARKKP